MIALYNFLSREIEEFKPISETVGLYTCGPTVYDYVHIGNWRTFIFEDILQRVLQFNGYEVRHVMNLTDIEDKIIKKASDEGINISELTSKYTKHFFEDLEKLNIVREADEPKDIGFNHYPRATNYIAEMITLIQKLLDKGIAYKSEDGIYFSVEKFPDYGKLSGLEKQKLKKGARVNDDEYDKDNWSDFALWKFPSSTKVSDGKPPLADTSWDAPFGKGRPGWHVECSAMSMALLGEQIDIHAGGVDLLFPHHENEIAQSEAATGKIPFARFWVEGEHLLVNGEKMAKSLGNIFTIADIIERGFDPLSLRYLFLTAHYRSKLNFTWESLKAVQNALNNLRQEISTWDEPKVGCSEFEGNFKQAVNSDLDMPKAIAIMQEMAKSDYPTSAKHQSILVMDMVLGLGLADIKKSELPKGAEELILEREKLRGARKFMEADKIREQLKIIGVEVEDEKDGTKWTISRTEITKGANGTKRKKN